MNRKSVIILASVAGVFIVLAMLMGNVYKAGLSRPPLKYAKISGITADFIRGLARMGGHMVGVNLVDGPFDWENEKDIGQDETEGWSREESDFFIVYYRKDKEAVWQGHAQNTLKAARENILPLTELMGKYYFPSDQNGRKLPIYLSTSEDEYFNTISKLAEKTCERDNSIGITVSQVGRAGCKSSIVLHPICFKEEPKSENGYIKVLMHEMNHYIFLSSLDISHDVTFLNWQIEGLADYCAHNFLGTKGMTANDTLISYIKDRCSLKKDFPSEINAQYWAGESYYRHMEKAHGLDFLKKFLKTSFQNDTRTTFSEMDINPDTEHKDWIEDLHQADSQQTAE